MATTGFGTTLAGQTAGTLGEITSINLPGGEVEDIDVTSMDSTDGWKEFLPGLKDAQQIEVELLYEKSKYQTVQNALGTNDTWTITLPDGSSFQCDGYIKANSGAVPMDDKMTQSVTIKLSGKPTFTPGT